MWQTGKCRQNERLYELCSKISMALRRSVISYYFVTHLMISEMTIHLYSVYKGRFYKSNVNER